MCLQGEMMTHYGFSEMASGSALIIIALIYNDQISTLTGGGCLRLMVLNKHTNCEQYNWGNSAAVLC